MAPTPPSFSRETVHAARRLAGEVRTLDAIASEVDVDTGYEGDWDIDERELAKQIELLAERRPVYAPLTDYDFQREWFCRISTEDADPYEAEDEFWGRTQEITGALLAEGLLSAVEVIEREGWVK